jgi:hypothetical protein
MIINYLSASAGNETVEKEYLFFFSVFSLFSRACVLFAKNHHGDLA